MEQPLKTSSRKKFLLWSASVISSVTILKFISGKKREEPKTVTMLTQDGKLVTMDIAALPSKKKKITNKELQGWIKK
ncbi:MAG: hypothetical protein ABIW38_13985 [Ferruginibacter sp.]